MRTLMLLTLTLLLSCRRDDPRPDNAPACITQLIEQNGRRSTTIGFVAIYRYKYQNRYVYLGISECCDQFNPLFDESCNALCSPSGGFVGTGDGKCPGFAKEATDETLLWQRPQ